MLRILLVQHDAASAKLIAEALESSEWPFQVERVESCAAGVARLGQHAGEDVAAVLVDSSLPDENAVTAFERLSLAAPRAPILILGAASDEDTARRAVQRGARDYLLKEHLDEYWLPKALIGMLERWAGAEALALERERTQVTLDSVGDAVVTADGAGKVVHVNSAAEILTGWSRHEAAGRPLAEVLRIVDRATREPAHDTLGAPHRGDSIAPTDNYELIRRDGREFAIQYSAAPIHDRSEQTAGTIVVLHDASDPRAMSARMSRLAQYDGLTDLPNRVLLNDRLTQAIEVARRHGQRMALLFVDVDRFKHINDSLGHAIGDQLLKSVARRLRGCVRRSDTVGRLGGDEFVVLLAEITHTDDAALTADKILVAMNAPHAIDGHHLHVTVSMGVGIYPDDGTDAETLIKNADVAMLHAKESGRNSHQFFRADMDVRAVEWQTLESELRGAVKRREFVLHYQPKMDLETGAIAGVEALIRWRHPERGLIAPAQFIPVAEECGLIVPIGCWVRREACRQARAWLDAKLPPLPMAINISAVELRSKDFVARVRAVLAETRLAPRFLELELTETALMQNLKSADAVLKGIKAMGIRVTLDDFGTGYSSLSYLKRFPIDALKIDQSFVRDMTTDADDAAIVSAVIAMGRSLRRRVVAEGVETREQLAFLRARRCGQGQGHYFSRPIVARELAVMLGAERSRTLARRPPKRRRPE